MLAFLQMRERGADKYGRERYRSMGRTFRQTYRLGCRINNIFSTKISTDSFLRPTLIHPLPGRVFADKDSYTLPKLTLFMCTLLIALCEGASSISLARFPVI
jgi:hypothetical protein